MPSFLMSVALLSYGRIEAENLADACPCGARSSGFSYRFGKFSGVSRSATSGANEQVLDTRHDLSLGRIERLHVVGDLVAPVDCVSVGPLHRAACHCRVYIGLSRRSAHRRATYEPRGRDASYFPRMRHAVAGQMF